MYFPHATFVIVTCLIGVDPALLLAQSEIIAAHFFTMI
jgi:hypothetical protein